jgi:hypothetical protein
VEHTGIKLMIDPLEIRLWLKGRNKANLRVCSNAHMRMLGFADISTADYITCDISTFVRDRSLYKFYIKINITLKKNHNDGAMLQYWLTQIISDTMR